LFYAGDGTRKTIRLGKATRREAAEVKFHVERRVSAKITGCSVDHKTARWLADLDDRMYAKLAGVGRVEPRVGMRSELAPFIDEYIAGADRPEGADDPQPQAGSAVAR
jgi:hypothetical protein